MITALAPRVALAAVAGLAAIGLGACSGVTVSPQGSGVSVSSNDSPSAGTGAQAGTAPSVISSANGNATYDCANQSITISGASNTLHFTGTCQALHVQGTSNTVAVDAVGLIDVSGTGNHVTWSAGLNGGQPQISNTGRGNTVQQGAGAPAPAGSPTPASGGGATPTPASGGGGQATLSPTTINGADINATYDCGNQTVTISGADNTIHFTGSCPTIAATGADNTITVDTVGQIQATGTGNHVTWHAGLGGGSPQIVNGGVDNTVQQG